MYQPNVTICGISSAPSTPNGGYAHSKMGNPSATDSSGGTGGGTMGGVSLPVLVVLSRAV